MPAYRTPGVYVEETSVITPAVAEVETAIPAFVGYTQKAMARVAKEDTATRIIIPKAVCLPARSYATLVQGGPGQRHHDGISACAFHGTPISEGNRCRQATTAAQS